MIGVGDFDTAALLELGVWREDDGLARAESFEDEAMAGLCSVAELDAPFFCGEFGSNDPNLSFTDKRLFGNVKSQAV